MAKKKPTRAEIDKLLNDVDEDGFPKFLRRKSETETKKEEEKK